MPISTALQGDLQLAYTAACSIDSAFSDKSVITMQQIDWRRMQWEDLATSERILLRCAYELYFRQPCPLPITPKA